MSLPKEIINITIFQNIEIIDQIILSIFFLAHYNFNNNEFVFLNYFDFALWKSVICSPVRLFEHLKEVLDCGEHLRVSSEETSTSFLGIVPVYTIVHDAQSAIRHFPYLVLIVIEFSHAYYRDS